jgi:hypothetical protein
MSYGSSRDASYQLTRLANTLDEMNRKLSRVLQDLERINRRLDTEKPQDQDAEPPREAAVS